MMPQLRTLTMPNLGPEILDAVATGLHLESLAIPGPARDLRTLLQIAKQAGISVVHLLGPANLSFDLATRRASLWFSPPMGVNPMTAAMELAAILGALSVPTFELAVPKRSRAHGQATADPLLPRHLELYQGELDLEPLWSRLASQGIPCRVVPEQAFGWSLSPNAKL